MNFTIPAFDDITKMAKKMRFGQAYLQEDEAYSKNTIALDLLEDALSKLFNEAQKKTRTKRQSTSCSNDRGT